MDRQHTLARPVTCRGIGVHSGRPAHLRILPAEQGTGIVFVRTDLAGRPTIPAQEAHVVETTLATTLGLDEARVSTVEHLLAALLALGIDNAIVEVDGPEVPIMDGSAAPFVKLLTAAGRAALDAPRATLVVDRPVRVHDGNRAIAVEPASGFEIAYEIDFDHAAIRPQTLSLALDPERFVTDLAPARTFGFLAEVEALKARGFARGGSLENAVVIGQDRVLNPEGLRFPDEFVRHKALDLVGDLALLGTPVRGRVVAARGGHHLHALLVRALLEDRSAWHLEGAAVARRRPPERARRALLVDPAPMPV